uniref:Uncharacterized protein n=1 Tax=Anopheles culicifacies TaxID=139723 RepID=A0A182LUH0_9DIPT
MFDSPHVRVLAVTFGLSEWRYGYEPLPQGQPIRSWPVERNEALPQHTWTTVEFKDHLEASMTGAFGYRGASSIYLRYVRDFPVFAFGAGKQASHLSVSLALHKNPSSPESTMA